MASCQGKSEILSSPDPGGWGSNSPGPSRIRAPSLRSAFTLSLNGARLARAEFTKGKATTRILRPGASARMPRAYVSLMPLAHLLMVLYVAGATMIASARGDLGSPGLRYSLRTGLPV